jgi:hypothetical protein
MPQCPLSGGSGTAAARQICAVQKIVTSLDQQHEIVAGATV